jgi:hypothetical protein
MVGFNKVKFCKKKNDYTCYFTFKFNDGLFYIQFDEEEFDKFEITTGGRTDRGFNEYNVYMYIPIDKLTKIII